MPSKNDRCVRTNIWWHSLIISACSLTQTSQSTTTSNAVRQFRYGISMHTTPNGLSYEPDNSGASMETIIEYLPINNSGVKFRMPTQIAHSPCSATEIRISCLSMVTLSHAALLRLSRDAVPPQAHHPKPIDNNPRLLAKAATPMQSSSQPASPHAQDPASKLMRESPHLRRRILSDNPLDLGFICCLVLFE